MVSFDKNQQQVVIRAPQVIVAPESLEPQPVEVEIDYLKWPEVAVSTLIDIMIHFYAPILHEQVQAQKEAYYQKAFDALAFHLMRLEKEKALSPEFLENITKEKMFIKWRELEDKYNETALSSVSGGPSGQQMWPYFDRMTVILKNERNRPPEVSKNILNEEKNSPQQKQQPQIFTVTQSPTSIPTPATSQHEQQQGQNLQSQPQSQQQQQQEVFTSTHATATSQQEQQEQQQQQISAISQSPTIQHNQQLFIVPYGHTTPVQAQQQNISTVPPTTIRQQYQQHISVIPPSIAPQQQQLFIVPYGHTSPVQPQHQQASIITQPSVASQQQQQQQQNQQRQQDMSMIPQVTTAIVSANQPIVSTNNPMQVSASSPEINHELEEQRLITSIVEKSIPRVLEELKMQQQHISYKEQYEYEFRNELLSLMRRHVQLLEEQRATQEKERTERKLILERLANVLKKLTDKM
ncbi:hypothetical protein G6F46_001523 [Rhizopus delemar]|uniref:Uncharacterized protein n=3 Tax=Rhizopus TaxID=4842 RepID=I1CQ58_RHIO9|nr:hypothetical protein RO3G_15299 [Rhizopus delemar RA 99-880]KAG1457571.1 hypothetical protein G6F55_005847 [Rhizopus delemar]KAG1551856.1 hypothetical protein G6F51_001587 [Rhizopus arrhizus]KAG1496293.1 hypothetical protein G6F54_006567 [Rhizopus delemar]KAG1517612.1 hypothetical protein G6F53_001237 [Rhizopus delemar]|eukprot:EIE90588.1 hypothetical protein RO3G_15299 [Rhizopus delemar RA 99-880]